MQQIFNTRTSVLMTIIAILALVRLLPHPPNFTPIAAMALFGGAFFNNKFKAFIVPFCAMLISDVIIGFHGLTMISVYISFGISVFIGRLLINKSNPLLIGGAAIASSLFFFLITNFAVWMGGTLYSNDLSGLATCYIAAVPFFHHTLIGDLFFTTVLFGGFIFAQNRIPLLVSKN